MIDDIAISEIDIQIAGTRLFDYIRDLMIVSGHIIDFDKDYQYLRIQFGDAVVELVRAIKYDLKRNTK